MTRSSTRLSILATLQASLSNVTRARKQSRIPQHHTGGDSGRRCCRDSSWVHVDLYIWSDGLHSSLVIDGDLTQATNVSFHSCHIPLTFAFAANALNSDWPESPRRTRQPVDLPACGRPPARRLYQIQLSVTQSGTESATLTASVSYGDDPAAERYVNSAGWTKCTSAGAVDYAGRGDLYGG